MRHSRHGVNALVFSLALLCGAMSTAPAWAQQASGIAGLVRDTSGLAMPGVTVEAASPALIEKVRTVTTDGASLTFWGRLDGAETSCTATSSSSVKSPSDSGGAC